MKKQIRKVSKMLSTVYTFMKVAEEDFDLDVIYTDENRGSYAEGRDDIRKVLIELLVDAFNETPMQPYAEEVVENLKETHGNSWFDEKAAIKMLDSVTEEGLTWYIEDNNLMLLGEDDFEYEYEEQQED